MVRSSTKRHDSASETGIGHPILRGQGEIGGNIERDIVVTVTEAVPLPDGDEAGVTAQVVAIAGGMQLSATAEAKPSVPVTPIAFENVAVCPANTVNAVLPCAAMVKSGPTTVSTAGTGRAPAGR